MMPDYTVKYYDQQSYRDRQIAANGDDAICFVAQHLNGHENPDADYCAVIVGTNASEKSIRWGQRYCQMIESEFGIPITKYGNLNGVVKGGYQGRGNSQLTATVAPAILPEPLFATNPERAKLLKPSALNEPNADMGNYANRKGIERLGRVLANSIMSEFPEGGLVAFSIGHGRYRQNAYGNTYMDYGTWVADAEKLGNGLYMHEWHYSKLILEAAEVALTGSRIDELGELNAHPFRIEDARILIDGKYIDVEVIEGLIRLAETET